MLRRVVALLAAIAGFVVIAARAQPPAAAPADLVIKNARVYTLDASRSWHQAIAVSGGTITYVGSDEGIARFQNNRTKVVDLAGKVVLPGFIDTHNHAYLRTEALFWVTFTTPTLEAYKAAAQAFLEKHPNAKQLRGVGFNLKMVTDVAMQTGRLPRQMLDDIVGRDIPAVIITNGHHQIWANTRAMQNARVTKETPDPQGAVVDRDANGEPTGIFREFGAQNLIIKALPEPDFTVDQFKEAILSFQQELAGPRGVTSILSPTHYPSDNWLAALQALDKENKLTVRYDVLLWADETRGTSQIPEFVQRRSKYKGKRFKIDSIKIFGTGAGADGLVWKQDVLQNTIAALDKEGFRVFIHDIGPEKTYSAMLDAIEYAQKSNGKRDARHTITHVNASAVPLVGRFKALDVIPDGHPVPKAFFDANVRASTSSDYPVTDFVPMTRVAAAVRNGVPLETILASYTINGAYAIFAERETGSIEVGKAADFVVMDKNVFDLRIDQLESAKTILTFFAGQEIFRDPSFH